jgi:hypothetical protein
MRTFKKYWSRFATCVGACVASIILFTALWVWGQSEPALTITPLGNNSYWLVLTNGFTTNQYELQWTPSLNNDNYPWTVLQLGLIGETNWEVDAGDWQRGFFRATKVQYYNGIPDYELADPNNPSLGRLSITIDSPLNGTVLQ